MGGGGVMRAAAKVAGVGVINSGLRGIPGVAPAEHPFASAARKATRPISANVTVSDEVQLNGPAVQRPCWEIDDWEMVGSGEPMPRLVFGDVPTLEETKEATSELKHAFHKAYLSPKPTGSELLSNSDNLETNACVASETTVISSVPKHAMQAFRFINENPAAQNVVASIACDPNVWSAVMANEAVVGFLQSHKNNFNFSDMDSNVKESVADADFQIPQSPKCFDELSDSGESAPGNGNGNWFSDYLRNIRLTVVEMMNSLSSYFQSLFGGPVAGEVSAEADGSAKITILDSALGASFMGLAVMVIMVVMLKRG